MTINIDIDDAYEFIVGTINHEFENYRTPVNLRRFIEYGDMLPVNYRRKIANHIRELINFYMDGFNISNNSNIEIVGTENANYDACYLLLLYLSTHIKFERKIRIDCTSGEVTETGAIVEERSYPEYQRADFSYFMSYIPFIKLEFYFEPPYLITYHIMDEENTPFTVTSFGFRYPHFTNGRIEMFTTTCVDFKKHPYGDTFIDPELLVEKQNVL
jgi:hypothetical protein